MVVLWHNKIKRIRPRMMAAEVGSLISSPASVVSGILNIDQLRLNAL